MISILAAALAFGSATTAPVARADHVVRVDHHSGRVEANYRGEVNVSHKQVGTAGPGGRPSTLRCMWTASMMVDRHARGGPGVSMTRSYVVADVATGSRPGWCDTNRAAIARDVAYRMRDVGSHMQMVAQEDHETLRAELDRLVLATGAG